MAELKKCPFCSGEAKVYEAETERNVYDSHTLGYVDTEYYTVHGVGCTVCNCLMAEFNSEEQAIEEWNNRVTEAEIRAKAIEEFAEKLCDAFSEKYGEVTVNGIKFDVLTLDGATEITWDVAEQLKGECVNEKEKF